jgi:hypothetical protein
LSSDVESDWIWSRMREMTSGERSSRTAMGEGRRFAPVPNGVHDKPSTSILNQLTASVQRLTAIFFQVFPVSNL